MSWSEYFASTIEQDKGHPDLVPMPAPCRDCAVVDCLYREVSDALALEPREIRHEVSRKWWCHNNPQRACRGNWDINGPVDQGGRGGGG